MAGSLTHVLFTAAAMAQAMTEYQNCMEEVETCIQQMDAAVKTMDATWNGDASVAFINNFNDLKKNLDTSKPSIQNAINDLKRAQITYEGNETTLANLIAALTDTTDPFAG